MSSKGSASDAKTDANRGLRVGVVGAGVMGSNHARVLAGLPGVTLARGTYAFEVAKDAKDRISLKTIATPLKDYQDAYHGQCAMK